MWVLRLSRDGGASFSELFSVPGARHRGAQKSSESDGRFRSVLGGGIFVCLYLYQSIVGARQVAW